MKDLIMLSKIMVTEKKAIFLAILLGFIASVSSIGLLGTGGYLLSQAALHPPLYTLTLTIIAVRFFGLTRAGSRYAERYFSHKATFSILGRLRVYFFDKIEPLAPALFSSYRSGDLLSRVVADVDRLQYFFLRVFYPPFVMLIVFITTGIFISTFSGMIAIVLLLGLILVGFIIPIIFTVASQRLGEKLRQIRSQLSVEMTEYLFGFTDLRMNGRLKEKQGKIEEISQQLIIEQEKDNCIAAKGEMFSSVGAFVVGWFVLLVGVMYVEAGEINGVFLAMLALMTLTSFEVATPMAAMPGHIEESRVAANRLFQLTKVKQIVQPKTQKITADSVELSFENVSFAYPNSERQVLNKFNLSVKAKQKMAIVGPSGSGKTSILNVLLKFYQEYDGDIYLGDWNLKEITEENAREFFSVVSQHNHFFNDTVRANLLLAKPDATDADLYQVLKQVSLGNLDLNSVLNERGLSLSGGERQRLAIARMVLKDAPIVLLDEPTTGLDSITEKEILTLLWPILDGKTVLYITHRLVGLEHMDRVMTVTPYFDESK